jgi:ribonuclease D
VWLVAVLAPGVGGWRTSSTEDAMNLQEPEIVTDQRALEAHCDQLRSAGFFAFDTEFIRDETYEAALCLIQITTDGTVVLVDPTADVDPRTFWELVIDPSIVTIVHAGKEDFEVCLRMTGQIPRNVFDVQIAAGFVGYGYPLSLLRLVERLVHRRITKAQTLTDWLRRPLTPEQIRYAAEDVLYLPRIYEQLRDEIERADRTAWAQEEFRRFEDPDFYRAPPEARAQRLKGSRKLDGLGLLMLERLIEWREQWAQSRNRPLRAMMRDDVLVEIARRRPKQARDLEVLRGFPQAKNRRVVREILEILEETAKTPKSEWPKPVARREETPMGKAMLDLLSGTMQAICHEERLSWSLLGSSQRVRDLLDFHAGRLKEKPPLLQGWRAEFIGQRLLDLLEGRSRLHVAGWPRNPRVRLQAQSTSRKKP